MAQALSFNLPTMSAIGAHTPVQQAFRTTRTGADRHSKAVTMMACHYDDKSKSIRVFCSDGYTRQCNIDRLPSIEVGRALWKTLQEYGKNGLSVQFVAAGGFSPDRWFYDVQPVANETVEM